MPKQFQCPERKVPVITYMRPGENATCNGCGRRVRVPDTTVEVDAPPPIPRPRDPSPAPAPTAPLSPEAERLVAIGRQLPTPTHRLYTIGGIGIAALWGSLFMGFLLISRNFHAAGEDDRATLHFWMGLGLTILLVGILWFLPPIPGDRALPGLLAIGVAAYAKKTQGALLDAHRALGGPFHSKWRAFWISMLFFVPVLVATLAIMAASAR